MGVSVEGAEMLKFLLAQQGQKAVKRAFTAMKKEGEAIADLARQMAPVDQGNLEEAIKSRVVGGGRDDAGRFARKEIVIEVDGNVDAGKGKTVGDYAYEIHEHQAPFGMKYQLGPKSRLKQDANPSIVVGGKYLERAIAEVEKGLVNRIIAAVQASID